MTPEERERFHRGQSADKDVLGTQSAWEINRAREERGERPISPPKRFRTGWSRVRNIELYQ